MATMTSEKELLELENEYWKAIQAGDFEAVLQLTDDPCLVAGASGVSCIDRDTFRSMMREVPLNLESYGLPENGKSHCWRYVASRVHLPRSPVTNVRSRTAQCRHGRNAMESGSARCTLSRFRASLRSQ